MADISNRDIVQTMRLMAWERAKAELRSMLHTYYPEYDRGGHRINNGFKLIDPKVTAFISEIDDLL